MGVWVFDGASKPPWICLQLSNCDTSTSMSVLPCQLPSLLPFCSYYHQEIIFSSPLIGPTASLIQNIVILNVKNVSKVCNKTRLGKRSRRLLSTPTYGYLTYFAFQLCLTWFCPFDKFPYVSKRILLALMRSWFSNFKSMWEKNSMFGLLIDLFLCVCVCY